MADPGDDTPDDDESPGSSDSDDADVIETDQGDSIVKLHEDESIKTADQGDFYDNIVNDLAADEVADLEVELHKKIEFDKESRKKRDEQYEEGLKRTGLGDDAPGGAKFAGASKVVHPMLVKGCIDFASRTVKEFLPKGDIVKSFIPGASTKPRLEKARREAAYMNWQCMKQMKNLRNEMEQGATQAPLGGAFYLRLIYDSERRRPMPLMVPIDDVLLPYAASSYYSAERVTYVEHITEYEFDRRVRNGQYIDIDLLPPPQLPEQTEAAKANDKIEGKTQDPYNEDGLRDIYEVSINLELTDSKIPKDRDTAPYLVTFDDVNRRILSVVRNWEEDDDTLEAMMWMVEFGFIPWRGAYPIGLTHIIGGLSAAATGALRALMDAALINNMPGLLKLKGVGMPGQTVNPSPTEVVTLEGPPGMDDIRKYVMPVPFNPPSMVLFQLLGFLVEQGEAVVKVALDTLTENPGQQLPVGTTLALIEQGMKVLSAIHSRWHYAFQQFLSILHRINRMYLTDEQIVDDTGELIAYRSDFQGPMDVIPVSDPEVFTDVQRFAQMQLVLQLATQPGTAQYFDMHKVLKMVMERTKIPDAASLLVAAPEIEEMNAVNENVCLALGRPVHAYPDQDHLAHIQVLLDFLNDPNLGMSPIIAPIYLTPALTHLKEHIVMWYAAFMEKQATMRVQQAAKGSDAKDPYKLNIAALMLYKDPDTRQEADRLLAGISGSLMKPAAQSAFSEIPAVIQQAQQMLAKFQQNAQSQVQDPRAQATIQAANIKAQAQTAATQAQQASDAQDAQLKQAEIAADNQRAQDEQTGDAQRTQVETQGDMATTQVEQQNENQRTAAQIQSKELINAADNQTAENIQAANAAAHAASNVTTGTAVGKERPGE
jgi:hypothetical protein